MSEIRVTTLKDTSGGNSSTTAQINSGRVKAWVQFNGQGTVAIRDSFNVNSMTDDGTGVFRANFASALTDINYIGTGSAGSDTTINGNYELITWPNTSSASWIMTYWQTTFYDLEYSGAMWIR